MLTFQLQDWTMPGPVFHACGHTILCQVRVKFHLFVLATMVLLVMSALAGNFCFGKLVYMLLNANLTIVTNFRVMCLCQSGK